MKVKIMKYKPSAENFSSNFFPSQYLDVCVVKPSWSNALAKLKAPSSFLYNPASVAFSTRLAEERSYLVVMVSWLEMFRTPSVIGEMWRA